MLCLLAAGADVCKADRGGWTALHWAAVSGRQAVQRCLLTARSDPDQADMHGRTPMDLAQMAAHNARFEVVLGASP